MNVDIFLKEAEKCKIKFTVINGKLNYDAPKSVVNEKFKNYLDKNKPEIITAITAQGYSNEPILFEKLTKTYVEERLLSLGLSKDDMLGVNDPALKLDEEELQDIRNNRNLFDIWVQHAYKHKQLRALEIAKRKQSEEYNMSDTLGSLPLNDRCKFVEHVLITFKKFFLEDNYLEQKPNTLFIEIWSQVNENLTLQQIFDASIKLIRLAKEAKKDNNKQQYKYFKTLSENAAYFINILGGDNE